MARRSLVERTADCRVQLAKRYLLDVGVALGCAVVVRGKSMTCRSSQ
jgi:hypothetical protein